MSPSFCKKVFFLFLLTGLTILQLAWHFFYQINYKWDKKARSEQVSALMESQTKEDRDKFKMRILVQRKCAVLSQCVQFHCKSKDFVINLGCIARLFRSRMDRNNEEDRNKFKMRTLIQSKWAVLSLKRFCHKGRLWYAQARALHNNSNCVLLS